MTGNGGALQRARPTPPGSGLRRLPSRAIAHAAGHYSSHERWWAAPNRAWEDWLDSLRLGTSEGPHWKHYGCAPLQESSSGWACQVRCAAEKRSFPLQGAMT
jgi:hypothetical protein